MEDLYPRTRPARLAYGLFWSWNTIFLAFMFLGLLVLSCYQRVLTGVRAAMIPAQYLAYGIILAAIPAAALILASPFYVARPTGSLRSATASKVH